MAVYGVVWPLIATLLTFSHQPLLTKEPQNVQTWSEGHNITSSISHIINQLRMQAGDNGRQNQYLALWKQERGTQRPKQYTDYENELISFYIIESKSKTLLHQNKNFDAEKAAPFMAFACQHHPERQLCFNLSESPPEYSREEVCGTHWDPHNQNTLLLERIS